MLSTVLTGTMFSRRVRREQWETTCLSYYIHLPSDVEMEGRYWRTVRCCGVQSDRKTDMRDHPEQTTRPPSVSKLLQSMADNFENNSKLPGVQFEAKNALIYVSELSKVLARRLEGVERERIRLISERRRSIRSDVQLLVESIRGSVIDWWPLPEPLRDLGRVVWSCVSV